MLKYFYSNLHLYKYIQYCMSTASQFLSIRAATGISFRFTSTLYVTQGQNQSYYTLYKTYYLRQSRFLVMSLTSKITGWGRTFISDGIEFCCRWEVPPQNLFLPLQSQFHHLPSILYYIILYYRILHYFISDIYPIHSMLFMLYCIIWIRFDT